MQSEIEKRIIVIRGIQSNLIEEAIIILKNEPEMKTVKDNKGALQKGGKSKDYIINEAEMIINSYIKNNDIQLPRRRNPERRKLLRKFNIKNYAVSALLFGVAALMVFLFVRFT